MSAHVILLELEGCGHCKRFREKVWPIICNTINADLELSGKVRTSTHLLSNGTYHPPVSVASLNGIGCRSFPTLIVLGPGEDRSTYKLNSSNLYPNRTLNGGLIMGNRGKVNILPLDWTINTLRTKYENYTPSQIERIQPPNRAILKEYVHPTSAIRLKPSQLSSV